MMLLLKHDFLFKDTFVSSFYPYFNIWTIFTFFCIFYTFKNSFKIVFQDMSLPGSIMSLLSRGECLPPHPRKFFHLDFGREEEQKRGKVAIFKYTQSIHKYPCEGYPKPRKRMRAYQCERQTSRSEFWYPSQKEGNPAGGTEASCSSCLPQDPYS